MVETTTTAGELASVCFGMSPARNKLCRLFDRMSSYAAHGIEAWGNHLQISAQATAKRSASLAPPGSAATICLAAAISCTANWARSRTLHCGITAPIFLLANTVFFHSELGIAAINQLLVWPLVSGVTSLAFLLEWRYGSRRWRDMIPYYQAVLGCRNQR